jgi:ATP-binding cassette, subfamily G (WHITE), member 2, SNQ2
MHFGQGSTGKSGTGFQFLVVLITELYAVALGQLLASITPTIQIAALFTSPIQIILSNMCGVTIPYPTLSKFWRPWLYQLDPFTRMLSAMLSTELTYVASQLHASWFWLTIVSQWSEDNV